ncbi:MAG: iron-sulfur cluster insertion protein ErpA [Pseudomonadota bacterium]
MTVHSPEQLETDVRLSESAARQIKKVLAREPDKTVLRVAVLGGGCSGFQYKFELEAGQQGDDVVIERDGAQVVIDQDSLPFLQGSVIDYVDDLIGAAFQIDNPNAQSSCGCGTSFSI